MESSHGDLVVGPRNLAHSRSVPLHGARQARVIFPVKHCCDPPARAAAHGSHSRNPASRQKRSGIARAHRLKLSFSTRHERCLVGVKRVGLTIGRSLPVYTRLTDIPEVSRHVSKVPKTEVVSLTTLASNAFARSPSKRAGSRISCCRRSPGLS